MVSSSVSFWISAAWVSFALLAALAADASSVGSWMLVTVVSIVPSLVLLTLWSDGPRLTIAEVLHATELSR